MTAKGHRVMPSWPEPCPRCGTFRLIGREIVVATTGAGTLPLGLRLRFWRYRRRTGAIVRRTYHCELCGCQWTRMAWREGDQA